MFIHGPSRTVMAFVSPHPTYTCGVNFHYNDGIMIFGMGLHSIFPPFWNHLEEPVLVVDFHTQQRGFPEINCFLFDHD